MIPQDDSQEVAAWMEAFAQTPLNVQPLADPSLLWWKAQLLRRWDAERRATHPIEIGEQIQIGIGVVGTLLILVWLWRVMPATSPSLAVVIVVSSILLALAVLFASWGRDITRSN